MRFRIHLNTIFFIVAIVLFGLSVTIVQATDYLGILENVTNSWHSSRDSTGLYHFSYYTDGTPLASYPNLQIEENKMEIVFWYMWLFTGNDTYRQWLSELVNATYVYGYNRTGHGLPSAGVWGTGVSGTSPKGPINPGGSLNHTFVSFYALPQESMWHWDNYKKALINAWKYLFTHENNWWYFASRGWRNITEPAWESNYNASNGYSWNFSNFTGWDIYTNVPAVNYTVETVNDYLHIRANFTSTDQYVKVWPTGLGLENESYRVYVRYNTSNEEPEPRLMLGRNYWWGGWHWVTPGDGASQSFTPMYTDHLWDVPNFFLLFSAGPKDGASETYPFTPGTYDLYVEAAQIKQIDYFASRDEWYGDFLATILIPSYLLWKNETYVQIANALLKQMYDQRNQTTGLYRPLTFLTNGSESGIGTDSAVETIGSYLEMYRYTKNGSMLNMSRAIIDALNEYAWNSTGHYYYNAVNTQGEVTDSNEINWHSGYFWVFTLLQMYDYTNNETYLNRALEWAEHMANNYNKTTHCIGGLANAGNSMLYIWVITGNDTWYNRAVNVAEFLIENYYNSTAGWFVKPSDPDESWDAHETAWALQFLTNVQNGVYIPDWMTWRYVAGINNSQFFVADDTTQLVNVAIDTNTLVLGFNSSGQLNTTVIFDKYRPVIRAVLNNPYGTEGLTTYKVNTTKNITIVFGNIGEPYISSSEAELTAVSYDDSTDEFSFTANGTGYNKTIEIYLTSDDINVYDNSYSSTTPVVEMRDGQITAQRNNFTASFASGTNILTITIPSMSEHDITIDSLNADGSSCNKGIDCISGYCVHGVCRSTSTYCGDGYCDEGESCSSCIDDCGYCYAPISISTEEPEKAIVTISSITPVVLKKVYMNSEEIPINEIEIKVKKRSVGVKIEISKSEQPPLNVVGMDVLTPSVMTYNYLTINVENLEDENIEEAKLKFEVEKTWLTDNGIDAEAVSLYRHSNNRWNKLKTIKLGEDDNYVYYEAITPGFSYFVIGGEAIVGATTGRSTTTTQPATTIQPTTAGRPTTRPTATTTAKPSTTTMVSPNVTIKAEKPAIKWPIGDTETEFLVLVLLMLIASFLLYFI